jgi:protein SCO1
MSPLRAIRLVAWVLVFAVGAALTVAFVVREDAASNVESALPRDARSMFGGPFSIGDMRGGRLTERDLIGRPALLFFGFTHCPDVCPTTLTDIADWFDRLGDSGSELIAYFATVDPDRDTPAFLREYLAAFGDRIVGLVGDTDETRRLAEAWRVFYRRVPLDGENYTIDHTASVFMIDRKGKFAGTIDFHEDREIALAKLRTLVR